MNKFLKWEQTLFKDERLFDIGHVPDEFLYRDKQMESIGYAIAPGIEGKQPQNIVCVGPPGTGKTTSFTKIIEEAEQIPASNLILVNVNCRLSQTHYSVLAEICKKITGIEPPTSGIALKKLYEKVAETLAAKNKSMFVILDDADIKALLEDLLTREDIIEDYLVNNFKEDVIRKLAEKLHIPIEEDELPQTTALNISIAVQEYRNKAGSR